MVVVVKFKIYKVWVFEVRNMIRGNVDFMFISVWWL